MRAYDAFLRGALAEEKGDFRAAALAYRAAAGYGPSDPEVWARIGSVTCKSDPRAADRAFAEALAIDPEFEGALERRAACDVARGKKGDFGPAFTQNPRRLATAVRAVASGDDPHGGDAAFALTVAYRESPAAWDALAAHARARGDARTEVRALAVRATLDAPGLSRALARAEGLAAAGFTREARALAGAALDARAKVGVDPAAPPMAPEARAALATLAVDDAIARGDAAATRRRAARAHVGLEEAAARALAFGEGALAEGLARPVAEADPGSVAAGLVLALAAPPGSAGAALAKLPKVTRPLPAALVVVLVERVLAAGGKEAARALYAGLAAAQVSGTDVLLVPRLVDLAVAGVVPRAALPPEGRVELAFRERRAGASAGPPLDVRADDVDGPHQYLVLLMGDAGGAGTRAARARVGSEHAAVVAGDVAYAGARGLAETAAVMGLAGHDAAGELLARVVAAGTGPMVLGARVELLRARGDAEGVARAQKLLRGAALALTEREAALVSPN